MSEQHVRPRLSTAEARRLRINLLRVAALAAGLGLLMQAILVMGGAAVATLSSLVGNGLWPFLVCTAVAVGQAVAGGWPTRAGAFAAVATPIAFLLAKVSEKGIDVLMNNATSGAFIDQPLLMEAGLRAIEYAVLTAALVWLGRQAWGGALAHLGLGAAIGVVFGLLIAAVLPPDSALGWVVEELVFPIGCALVIFASETLTRLLPEDTAPGAEA
jgi:hypothetical protein